jgi:hypothetical protein
VTSPTVHFQQCHISYLVWSNSLLFCVLTISESSSQMPIRTLNLSTLTTAGNLCHDLLHCGPQMVKGNERTVVLFGMSCHESYVWSDNISFHTGCHKAMKKLSSGSCVGMNKRTGTWKRVYWPASIAKGETYTHILLFSRSSVVPSISVWVFVLRWSGKLVRKIYSLCNVFFHFRK